MNFLLSIAFAVFAFVGAASAEYMQDSSLNLTEVVWLSERPQVFVGSPSILKIASNQSQDVLLLSADRFGSGFAGQDRNVSLYHSNDDGDTWEFSTWVTSQYWSNLFTLTAQPGKLFLLGTDCDGPASIKISVSNDGGASWEGTVLFPKDDKVFGYETGPTPSLVANGRVYRAIEKMVSPFAWGVDYQATILSAPLTADLAQPSSWTISKPLPFNNDWIPETWGKLETPGYLEGNAVEGPDGGVYNILRLNSRPHLGNSAVVLKYNEGANELEYDSIIDLPGGHTKFVIHKDPVTSIYLTLSNNNTDVQYQDQRNVLVLCASSDMYNWTILDTLLQDDTGFTADDSAKYTGFHYVDWQIDGDDIIYAIRTAYRGAVSYHNSNRITFKRLLNFREYFSGLVGVTSSTSPLLPPFIVGTQSYSMFLPNSVGTVDIATSCFLPNVTLDINGKQTQCGVVAQVEVSADVTPITIAAAHVPPVTIKAAHFANVTISGKGYRIVKFGNGASAFSNRDYKWEHVPTELQHGMCFTQIDGGAVQGSVSITVKTRTAGAVVAVVHDSLGISSFTEIGFDVQNSLTFAYSTNTPTNVVVVTNVLTANSTFFAAQHAFVGAIVIFPEDPTNPCSEA